jgi:glycosyltransferase involved in cell wall biosynthesis
VIWFWLWGTAELCVWLYYFTQAAIGFRNLAWLTEPQWDIEAELWNRLPRLQVVVPARNEAAKIEECLRSLVRSLYPNLSMIAVDDRSTDTTGAIMDRLQHEFPTRLSVLHVTDLPDGWLGKTHAMWLGAQQTENELILFTDGDVVFAPKALARAIHYMESEQADHLVLFPTLLLKGLGETAMIALFQTLLIFEHRPWKVADPKSKEHIGVGAFNLVRRSAYERIGTYESLRLAILDDMKLGERIKRFGFRQRAAYGRDLVRIRWAHGALGVIRGLTKNAFAVADFRPGKLLFLVLGMLIVLLGPYAGAILAPGMTKLPFLLALAIIAAQYVGLWREMEIPAWAMVTHPLAALLFIYAMLRSMIVILVHGGIEWRGTHYSLAEIRRWQQQ